MVRNSYPKNPYIRNGKIADLYLSLLRRRWNRLAKVLGLLMGCQITCPIPSRLFLPHPIGIVVDSTCILSDDVVLLQQVTLGSKYPYGRVADERVNPTLQQGVYVGPGARVLGPITIGEWSVIGANAVITRDVPAYSIAVGHNKILDTKTTELELKSVTGENCDGPDVSG
jgi:serine O-acetyltransferase